MSDWWVVMTRPAAEEAVAAGLARRGWRVYLPRVRRVLKGVLVGEDGRRRRTRGAGAVVMRPMFPRYLFAESGDGRWGGVLEVSGVVSLVGSMGDGGYWEPGVAGDGLVEGVRLIEASGEFDEGVLGRERVDLVPGQLVRVAGLDDRVGRLLEVGEGERSWVLLGLLGREVRVGVETRQLTAVVG